MLPSINRGFLALSPTEENAIGITVTQIVVWKVGGSLLTRCDLPRRLSSVLQQRPGTRPLLVAGGGAAADVVRDWDQLHGLGEHRAHWLALRSLGLNESLLRELLPDATCVVNRSEADRAWWQGRLPILCAHDFVRAEEPKSQLALPHCWDVTSDSVAAWIALQWPADELILLKSTSLPEECDVGTAGGRRLVDPCFPNLAPHLSAISWANLQDGHPRIVRWLP